MSPILTIPAIASGVAAVLASSVLTYTLKNTSLKDKVEGIKSNESLKLFGETLYNGLKLSIIKDINDVKNIYVGSGYSSKTDNQEHAITMVLQLFLFDLLSEKYEANEEEINEWKNKVTEFINKFEDISPYEELPQYDRSILNDIDSFIELNDKFAIKRKMGELAGVMKTRQDHLNKLENSSKISNAVAVIGIVLTIVFGLLPIILPLLRNIV